MQSGSHALTRPRSRRQQELTGRATAWGYGAGCSSDTIANYTRSGLGAITPPARELLRCARSESVDNLVYNAVYLVHEYHDQGERGNSRSLCTACVCDRASDDSAAG